MWGRLVAPQRGQMLREGALTRQADARRIRVFDFDIFFFGTGMFWLSRSVQARSIAGTNDASPTA